MALPSINHDFEGGHDAVFPDLEEVTIPSDSLEELHDYGAMRVRGDAGLDKTEKHLAVSSQGKLGVVHVFPHRLVNTWSLTEGRSAFTSCYEERRLSKLEVEWGRVLTFVDLPEDINKVNR